jgi:hypothetical protein
MRVLTAAVAVAAMIHAAAGIACAEDGPGQIITRSFTPIPAPLVMSIEPDDNTRTNMALAERMSRELARRGVQVPASDAPLVLRFDSEIRSNVTSAGARYQREASGADDSDMSIGAAGAPDRPVVANLFSSAQGRGVIGQRSGEDYSRPLRYVVNARIEERQNRTLVWQGHASYDSDRTNADPILEAMVPLLIEEIGKTVRDRRFSID